MRTSPAARLLIGAVLCQLFTATGGAAQEVPQGKMTRIEVGGAGVQVDGGAISPDGRWLVFERWDGSTRSSLWIAPATGGEPARLTDEGYNDSEASWSPAGDRIYFVSNRPTRGGSGSFVMVQQIDPRSGRAIAAPRQVTIEKHSFHPVPSPDGRLVAYRSGTEVRVVPAQGGNSRLLASAGMPPLRLAWEPDGSAVYYSSRVPPRGQAIFRVATSGGKPEEILLLPRKAVMAISPAARLIAVASQAGGPRERAVEVLDWSGKVLSRNVLKNEFQPRSFAPDGRSLIIAASDVGAVMRVRPVNGGEPHDLTDGTRYDWPVAWTADGRAVIVHSVADDGTLSAGILPLDGQRAHTIPLPKQEGLHWGWGSPTHVTYSIVQNQGQPDETAQLFALDLTTRKSTLLSSKFHRPMMMIGPGGLYRDTNGFYYAEPEGDRLVFKTSMPGAPARKIFSAPLETVVRSAMAFHEHKIAYLQLEGDSVAVMLKDSFAGAPRLLAKLAPAVRRESCCRGSLAFSHDGRRLAAGFQGGDDGFVYVFQVPAQGRAGDVRKIDLEAEYWYEPRWLADNSGFTVIAGSGANAWVAYVPLAAGEPVRHLTREENTATWGHELSPDGKYVVYPAEKWHGSSIWKLEFKRP